MARNVSNATEKKHGTDVVEPFPDKPFEVPKDKEKAPPPKGKKREADVVDPFPGDPFELPKGKSGRVHGLTSSTLDTWPGLREANPG